MIFFDDISGHHTHHQIIEIYALVAAVADVRIGITVLWRFDVCQGQRGSGGCPGGSHLLLRHPAIGGRAAYALLSYDLMLSPFNAYWVTGFHMLAFLARILF